MKSTLEELHITSPSGKTESLYIKEFATQVELQNYATKEEFTELQSFVDNLYDLILNGVNYFYIESLQDNNIITFNGYHLGEKSSQIEYSINNKWNSLWYSLSGVSQLSLNNGDRVYLRCIDGNICRTNSSNTNAIFDTTFEFNIGGNIETLLFDCKQLFEKHTYVNYNMTSFFRNSKVVNSSKLILPATTLADYCYYRMFDGCTSLTTAPELPATTLARYCYASMFEKCTSLTTAPELPATTLSHYCYQSMFSECSSLTTAPELPATTLSFQCYAYMFRRCSSLTTAPILSATTLADNCYAYMFLGCDSLTIAPGLPATTLTDGCYSYMFQDCTSLNYIVCLATNTSVSDCTTDWVDGVASTGTFIKNSDMNNWNTGTSGIPEGWTVEDANLRCVTFTAEEDNSSIGLNELSTYQQLEYSTNMANWNTMGYTTNIKLANTGDKVYIRGILSAGSNSITQFKMTGKISASGNCNAIWNYKDLNAPLKQNCGYYMFSGCTSLTTAPELPATTLAYECYQGMFKSCNNLTQAPELPATTLADWCYSEMFYDCTSLITAPELPATTLARYCYSNMFEYCSSLTTAPELPATTLAECCYQYMFYGCTSLTTAPELPATELIYGCYAYMFGRCSALRTAPELPATTLTGTCYAHMFYGCTSLNYIKCLATGGIFAASCTFLWVSNVSNTGTFIKHPDVNDWTTGDNGIPKGWTVEDADMPYVTFIAEEDNSSIGLTKLSTNQTLEYSTDTTNWNTMDTTTNITLANTGDEIYIRGILSADNSTSNYTQFNMTGKITASGNCNAIWNYQDLRVQLKGSCGINMFKGCTSLTTAPELPATMLATGCYQAMFMGCTNITTAPELPSTILSTRCYANMFKGCTSLTTAPELPALTTVAGCYTTMFNGCISLNYIKCLATDISASKCTFNWVTDVSSTGTFIKHQDMDYWYTGTSGIPEGWTVEDYVE